MYAKLAGFIVFIHNEYIKPKYLVYSSTFNCSSKKGNLCNMLWCNVVFVLQRKLEDLWSSDQGTHFNLTKKCPVTLNMACSPTHTEMSHWSSTHLSFRINHSGLWLFHIHKSEIYVKYFPSANNQYPLLFKSNQLAVNSGFVGDVDTYVHTTKCHQWQKKTF